jgi:hypothetical protein
MAKWKYKISFKDIWSAKQENRITLREMASKIANRIKKNHIYTMFPDDLEMIVDGFELMGDDPEFDDVEDFDYQLAELYAWADFERAWIETR